MELGYGSCRTAIAQNRGSTADFHAGLRRSNVCRIIGAGAQKHGNQRSANEHAGLRIAQLPQ
jgi:hypothetical protein